ncbi:TonB-dependent receptor [Methyloterricola oryzae]|uniref:TonB-dependent receptor n=1 Tax=Methyloterricola oryzae TaxID=1495050 RepID=UPI000A8A8C1B|nr:TonB-dependent receptor [Methyloterricola oryzae]
MRGYSPMGALRDKSSLSQGNFMNRSDLSDALSRRTRVYFQLVFPFSACLLAANVLAHPQQTEDTEAAQTTTLETVKVEGRASDLLGIATSASQGEVGQPEFKFRPLSRVGELVEVVPGAIATQHSGSGKANQYFLRGFNLDHGTDFSVTLDGVPMNLPTHAHGQGYLDLNSVIPELVDKVEYGKGPYYVDAGDFSSAGYARMHTFHSLPEGFVKFTGGEYDFYRGVAANSNRIGRGDLLYGAEVNFFNGPWVQPEHSDKYNGMLRYTVDEGNWGGSINGKIYHSRWTATNQIPEALVEQGRLDLYGTMDPTDGGNTNRYSLASNLWSKGDNYKSELNIYAAYYDVQLYSNFTYFLDDPIRGDQIEQKERRVIGGGNGETTFYNNWFGFDVDNTFGFQVRHDSINGLGLNHTQNRQLLDRKSLSDVEETSYSFYYKNQTHWLEKFRTIAGLRTDTFVMDVTDRLNPVNSGNRTSTFVSPKLSLIFGPWYDTEFFINLGYGLHSNDARGTTTRVAPDGTFQNRVSPMAKQRGAEGGIRTQAVEGLTSTLAVWYLRSASELVFAGDAGTTEPTGESERVGVEWTNYYKPTDWLTLDADLAFASAEYLGVPRYANNVPNSVGRVISAGAVIQFPYNLYGVARLRHFGQMPLSETNYDASGNKAWGGSTTLVTLGGGYQYQNYKVELDIFNLFNSKANDIAYDYTYNDQPGGTPGVGVDGILKHPVMPRMVRVTASVSF